MINSCGTTSSPADYNSERCSTDYITLKNIRMKLLEGFGLLSPRLTGMFTMSSCRNSSKIKANVDDFFTAVLTLNVNAVSVTIMQTNTMPFNVHIYKERLCQQLLRQFNPPPRPPYNWYYPTTNIPLSSHTNLLQTNPLIEGESCVILISFKIANIEFTWERERESMKDREKEKREREKEKRRRKEKEKREKDISGFSSLLKELQIEGQDTPENLFIDGRTDQQLDKLRTYIRGSEDCGMEKMQPSAYYVGVREPTGCRRRSKLTTHIKEKRGECSHPTSFYLEATLKKMCTGNIDMCRNFQNFLYKIRNGNWVNKFIYKIYPKILTNANLKELLSDLEKQKLQKAKHASPNTRHRSSIDKKMIYQYQHAARCTPKTLYSVHTKGHSGAVFNTILTSSHELLKLGPKKKN
ncbi:hypothetical protein GQR58_018939 [Nymphon striatum]|nr:hypothetical protein GQR58_018939 [Nymphon striatum]